MKREYRGHTIEVSQHMTFVITAGPLLERDEESTGRYSNATYQGITEYIDRGLAAVEREKRVKISLPIITDKGERKNITGLNARTGYLTGVGDTTHVYPDVPWIRDVLTEMREIDERKRALQDSIGTYRMRISYAAYSTEEYDVRIKGLQETHAKLTKLAEKAAPK
jgi:hypothetical protein